MLQATSNCATAAGSENAGRAPQIGVLMAPGQIQFTRMRSRRSNSASPNILSKPWLYPGPSAIFRIPKSHSEVIHWLPQGVMELRVTIRHERREPHLKIETGETSGALSLRAVRVALRV